MRSGYRARQSNRETPRPRIRRSRLWEDDGSRCRLLRNSASPSCRRTSPRSSSTTRSARAMEIHSRGQGGSEPLPWNSSGRLPGTFPKQFSKPTRRPWPLTHARLQTAGSPCGGSPIPLSNPNTTARAALSSSRSIGNSPKVRVSGCPQNSPIRPTRSKSGRRRTCTSSARAAGGRAFWRLEHRLHLVERHGWTLVHATTAFGQIAVSAQSRAAAESDG
jgi:hypothetical protein